MNRDRIAAKRKARDIADVCACKTRADAQREIARVRDDWLAFKMGALNLACFWDEYGKNPILAVKDKL